MHADHLDVLAEGRRADLAPASPVDGRRAARAEARRDRPPRRYGRGGQGRRLRHRRRGRGQARRQEGDRRSRSCPRRPRVRDRSSKPSRPVAPITFESEAEKPTRSPGSKKPDDAAAPERRSAEDELPRPDPDDEDGDADVEPEDAAVADADARRAGRSPATRHRRARRRSAPGAARAAASGGRSPPRQRCRGGRVVGRCRSGRRGAGGARDAGRPHRRRGAGRPGSTCPTQCRQSPGRAALQSSRTSSADGVPQLDEPLEEHAAEAPPGGDAARKRTRRGSRGGRNSKRKTPVVNGDGAVETDRPAAEDATVGSEHVDGSTCAARGRRSRRRGRLCADVGVDRGLRPAALIVFSASAGSAGADPRRGIPAFRRGRSLKAPAVAVALPPFHDAKHRP